MKTVFIKTVRSTGRSVHARGKLARIYEIGKRYTFNKEFPAHVGDDLESYSIENDSSLEAAYKCRPECNYGNRVLLCYGETKEKVLTIRPIDTAFGELRLLVTTRIKSIEEPRLTSRLLARSSCLRIK